MAWTITAVRDELKTRIVAYGIGQVYATAPAAPVLPCAIIAPALGPFADRASFDGDVRDLNLVVTVLVSKVVDEYAQNTLDTYLSAGELRDAIDSNNVAHAWDFAMAGPDSGYGAYTFGDGEAAQTYLGFTIPVTVGVS